MRKTKTAAEYRKEIKELKQLLDDARTTVKIQNGTVQRMRHEHELDLSRSEATEARRTSRTLMAALHANAEATQSLARGVAAVVNTLGRHEWRTGVEKKLDVARKGSNDEKRNP